MDFFSHLTTNKTPSSSFLSPPSSITHSLSLSLYPSLSLTLSHTLSHCVFITVPVSLPPLYFFLFILIKFIIGVNPNFEMDGKMGELGDFMVYFSKIFFIIVGLAGLS